MQQLKIERRSVPSDPHLRPPLLALLVALALILSAAGTATAQDESTAPVVIRDPEVSNPVTPFVFEGDLRDLPAPEAWQPGDPIKEIPRRHYPRPGEEAAPALDAGPFVDLLYEAQRFAPDYETNSFGNPSRNFAGQTFSGVVPPDTVGDVGPNYYIQMINSSGGGRIRIYNKAEPVPSAVTTFSLDNLGSGSCASGLGDGVVLYDRLAERWLLSEFSNSGNRLCVYISQTEDPMSGGWHSYAFQAPTFPDYPKYGVWPTDANGGDGSYVVTVNDGGLGIYALDRGAMLQGAATTFQRLTMPRLSGFGFQAPTPADLDGPTPPPDLTPAIIMRHHDSEVHSGPAVEEDLLEMWALDVDWITPSNTTLTQMPIVEVTDFDSRVCGLGLTPCFPQPNTGVKLDAIQQVIMFRVQYMQHEHHESLLCNFVVDVDETDHGGVRWVELRREGTGPWTTFQEGTFAIDQNHRWMAASAMDQEGNIALGYSVSSETAYPSLRYTGRLATDPPNVMTQHETVLHAGNSSSSVNRWGDYAAMNLDPEDECTFWFTSLDTAGSYWRTQIASFRFNDCGCLREPLPPVASAAPAGDNQIDISWNDSEVNTITEYRLRRSLEPAGAYETIAIVPDSSPGVGDGPGYVFSDTEVSGGTTYYYTVVSTDGDRCTSIPSVEVSATATGVCTLPPDFDGLQAVSTPFYPTCQLDLNWDEATSDCATPLAYNIYRSTDPIFVPAPSDLVVNDYDGTHFADVDALETGVPHYYVVRAVDTVSGVEEDNQHKAWATPYGPLYPGTWTDDAGDTGQATMIPQSPWSVDPTEGNLGPAVYKSGTYLANSCTELLSPEIRLLSGSQLSFDSKYAIESLYDKGEVQISTDDGASWDRVEVNYPGSSTQTGDACEFPEGSYFTGVYLDYATYTADLSDWDDQTAQIRFALSSDEINQLNGWWVDDIDITHVNLPGTCEAGSTCADNPSVDVTPEGPIVACASVSETLNVTLDGGIAPFHYQWTRDGVAMGGETASVLDFTDTGLHQYNVEVRSDVCEAASFDPIPTQIDWRDAPEFDGIDSASNSWQPICTINLAWDPASTICPGPITYSVYRSTTTPVAVTPANRVATGLTGTTHADSTGLVTGVPYYYLVRAVEGSTGQADSNVAELSAVATGFGGGSCTTVSPSPPSVPDGSEGSAPLGGSRITPAGDELEVTWDAVTCPADSYNLIFGDLDAVATYDLSGARCSIGTTGVYTWSGVPAGDLYFLIVGSDGVDTESSWGTDSDLNERNGAAASGTCLVSIKNTDVPCP